MAHVAALTHEHAEAALDLQRLIAQLLYLDVYLLLQVLAQLEELFLFGHAGERERGVARIELFDLNTRAEHVLIVETAVDELGRLLAARHAVKARVL